MDVLLEQVRLLKAHADSLEQWLPALGDPFCSLEQKQFYLQFVRYQGKRVQEVLNVFLKQLSEMS